MALADSDLFLVQSASDNKLYKIRTDKLIEKVEAGSAITFKGSVELADSPATNGIVIASAKNGDMYVVESTTSSIDGGWTIQDSPASATKGDRILWDDDNSQWILITSGGGGAGTLTGITATSESALHSCACLFCNLVF